MYFFFFLMIRRPPRSTLFPYTNALPISRCPAPGVPSRSSIHLAHDDVDRRVDRDQVAQQVALRHLGKRREVDERRRPDPPPHRRSEEHTSELQSLAYLVCRLLLEKKKDI